MKKPSERIKEICHQKLKEIGCADQVNAWPELDIFAIIQYLDETAQNKEGGEND